MRSLLLFLSLFCSEFDYVPAEITATKFLKDPEALISNNTNFKLGFFSPDNSTNRFVGIWYNVVDFDLSNVVWVANKDTPLNDSSGALKISEDGDLRIINDQNKVLWSSNSSYNATNNLVVKLLDSGNLVLLENTSETTLWQSFDHPTDSFLPPAKLTIDETMYGKPILRSWKSLSDPSTGHFSLGVSGLGLTEIYIWGGDNIFWRSGPWNGNIFLGLFSMYSKGINGFGVLDDHQRHTFYITYTTDDRFKLVRYILEYNGSLVFNYWDKGRMWRDRFQLTECDVFGNCGSFGSCNPTNVPICDCLEGFIPKNMEEWDKGNWSSGCVRRMPLHCGTAGGRADGFWKLKKVKPPVDGQLSSSELDEDHCKKKCLSSCSCLAYAFYSAFGCMFWNESLIDIQELHTNGVDLYVRLDHSELGGSRKWVMTVVITVIIGIAIIASLLFYLWRYKVWKKLGRKVTMTQDYFAEAKGSKVELDLPLFEFEKLVIATNNFDQMNKLGEGGFGPVYKGKLEDGREIAVKRLSRASGQGVHEFMNEVHVISKLQHRNLVRLFGCCVEREEKLLVYEFMSNKSLDALLFDPVYQKQLDWRKRFTIIQGICRGILYLHRDSRLRIIHRDLKASNILLDEDLNPKISDFGTARIFGIKQDQANTLRVVGTYGYMSPEYAMDGRFSEKSDVYSFGVVLLEVINGRKNGSFHNEECHTLLGYAWKLWNEDKLVSLIDKTMFDPSFQGQIMRCIHVGLLCVQENPEDRPNMSMVNSMIENEETNLPNPVQPGFIILRGRVSHGSNNMPGLHSLSVNLGSGTLVTGR